MFLRKDDNQSWDDVLEAAEEWEAEDASGGPPDAAAWALIVADARLILGGEVEEFRSADAFELSHVPTGVQVSLFGAEAGITVPYWYKGADAMVIMELVYRLGHIVEKHTGMSGYDGQVGMALAEATSRPRLSAKVFDQVAESFARRPIGSPSNDAADWEVDI